jgi:hypothetical protein
MGTILLISSDYQFAVLIAKAIGSMGYTVRITVEPINDESPTDELILRKLSKEDNNITEKLLRELYACQINKLPHSVSHFPFPKKKIQVNPFYVGSNRKIPVRIVRHRGSHFFRG